MQNLVAEHGEAPLADFARAYPMLQSTPLRQRRRSTSTPRSTAPTSCSCTSGTTTRWCARIGAHRRDGGSYRLLFHDTHHRCVTEPAAMAAYDLRHYDGVLAFGEVIRDLYLRTRLGRRAWTWHEAADTRVFRPLPDAGRAKATSSGSATGATTSAPRSCTSSCSSRCRRSG